MALLDYKISNFSRDGRHVKALVTVSRGSFQDVVEPVTPPSVTGGTTTVSRYVRIAKVRERIFEADVPRDMTAGEFFRKVRAHLNKKLLDWASANGHTVITAQQDISEYEPFSNEKEV